jgi:hypothetical protein
VGLIAALVVVVGVTVVNLRYNFGFEIGGSGSGVVVRYGYVELGWPRDVPEVAFTIRESSPRLPLMPRFNVFFKGDGTLGSLAYHQAAVPLWMVIVGIGLPLLSLKPRRRRRTGACTACGYDLNRLPAASPCPECGREGTKSP